MQGFLAQALHLKQQYKECQKWSKENLVYHLSIYIERKEVLAFFRATKKGKQTPSQIYGIVLLNMMIEF